MAKKLRKNNYVKFDASGISADVETSLFVLNGLRAEYPKQYATATPFIDKTIVEMDNNCLKMSDSAIEQVCYWVALGTYAYSMIDQLRNVLRNNNNELYKTR